MYRCVGVLEVRSIGVWEYGSASVTVYGSFSERKEIYGYGRIEILIFIR